MAKTTKDDNEIKKTKKALTDVTVESSVSKRVLPKKEKKIITKKDEEKKVATKKPLPKEKKAAAKKTLPKEKKAATKKTLPKEKKGTTKRSLFKEKNPKVISSLLLEHYDLPNMYNKTFIVLLAQTPKTLFAFWEISSKDKINLIEKYGSHFFENTRPVLVIINKTTNTSFEIEINDYTTDWYIDVDKTDCEFEVLLGRKPYNSVTDDFILIASSNTLTSPNDHILLEKLPKTFKFFNLKTKEITEKSLNTTSFSQIYNIYNFYKELYRDELQDNPSSK